MSQIITSLLDSDIYKISMMYFVWKNTPEATVKYRFVCRNKDVKLGFLVEDVRREILAMMDLRFTEEDIDYLKKLRYLSHSFTDYRFFDFLREYKMCLNKKNKITLWNDNGDLVFEVKGKWVDTILYEVPVLAIVNELYFRSVVKKNPEVDWKKIGEDKLDEKIALINGNPNFKFCEFGTRRRFSKEWQDFVVSKLVNGCKNNLIGTSNLFLARKYNLTPIGTISHEVFSGYLGISNRIENAQRDVLYLWMATFDTVKGMDLGIALSDTFTVNAFLRDFKKGIATVYSGVRHDSGDPFEFGEKMINHYELMDIDPKTKTIIFSDGLNFPLAMKIFDKFYGRINISFGIGTDLTCDNFFKALNIVIKLVECNGKQCVKLSDNPSKAIGDPEMIEKVKKAYGVV